VKKFKYGLDPLCLLACFIYAVNRWYLKPHFAGEFIHGHLNDLLVIPAALPIILWVQRLCGVRKDDQFPTVSEIAFHWLVWSIVCEGISPLFMPWSIADWQDVLDYGISGVVAGFVWEWMKTPGFDCLADGYDWMEKIVAGNRLERCRNAFWSEMGEVNNVLLAGVGHGRFLVELKRRYPQAKITCIDASARMLKVSRRHLLRKGLSIEGVELIHADLLVWEPTPGQYDLIGTHFFLDCFTPSQLSEVVKRLRMGAKPGAYWHLSDFQIPDRGWRRVRAQIIIWLMYRFFRVVTDLPAASLADPEHSLRASGFICRARKEFEWGLLCAELWECLPS